MMHGITAILLPCIVSGYLLVGAHIMQVHLQDKPGSNDYFRILVAGFFWFGFCTAVVFPFVSDEYTWKSFASFIENSLDGSSAYLFGYGAALAAVILRRAVLDPMHNVLRKNPNDYFHMILAPLLWGRGKNMEIFLVEAIKESLLVVLALKNDKVYVAWGTFVGTIKDTPEWLNFYPVASGCLAKSTRKIRITTSKSGVRKNMEAIRGNRFQELPQKMSVAVREIVDMQFLDPKELLTESQSNHQPREKAAVS